MRRLFKEKNSEQLRAEFFLLVITLGWGTTFVIIKIILSSVPPLLFLSLRFTLAALLFLLFFWKKLFPFSIQLLKAAFLLSLWNFIGFAAQTAGLSYTTASNSGFITGSYVIFTPLLQALFYKKTLSTWSWAASGIAFTGIYLLSGASGTSFSTFFASLNIGDLLTLVCAFFFALLILELDRTTSSPQFITEQNVTYKLAFVQIAACAFLSGIGSFFEPQQSTFSEASLFSINFAGALFYLATVATLISTLVQTRYQKDTTPARASIIFMLEAVFSAGFAYLFLDEVLSPLGYLGAVMLIISFFISEKS
ncbi:MAG: DMT family transporter [Chloroherpetonaceae bacterium]|nr:DMT family transporter [Chloroherpetonaceae bacterium]